MNRQNSRKLKIQNEKLVKENEELKQAVSVQQQLSLSLSKHDHNHTHNVTVSDLPPPDIFGQYPPELQALILKRIETDIDNDRKLIELEEKEQILRGKELEDEVSIKKRGQIYAFSALLLLSGLAIYFAENDAYKIAGTIVAVTIVGSITAFTGFGRAKEGKRDKAVSKRN